MMLQGCLMKKLYGMTESEMKEIIEWLDVKSNPLLIQGTKDIIHDLLKQVKVSINSKEEIDLCVETLKKVKKIFG